MTYDPAAYEACLRCGASWAECTDAGSAFVCCDACEHPYASGSHGVSRSARL